MKLSRAIFHTNDGFHITIYKTEDNWFVQVLTGKANAIHVESREYQSYKSALSFIKRKYIDKPKINRRWTNEEDEYLDNHFGSKSNKDLASVLNRTERAIASRASILNLKKNKAVYALFKKDQFLAQGSVKELASELYVSESTIQSHIYNKDRNKVYGVRVD